MVARRKPPRFHFRLTLHHKCMCPHFWLVAKSAPDERRQYCSEARGLMVFEPLLLTVNLPQSSPMVLALPIRRRKVWVHAGQPMMRLLVLDAC